VQVRVDTVQAQPAPLIAVAVKPDGSASVIVTVPLVVTVPAFDTASV
jgi:hypothetical protein